MSRNKSNDNVKKWDAKSLLELYRLREEGGKTWTEIAKVFKVSAGLVKIGRAHV